MTQAANSLWGKISWKAGFRLRICWLSCFASTVWCCWIIEMAAHTSLFRHSSQKSWVITCELTKIKNHGNPWKTQRWRGHTRRGNDDGLGTLFQGKVPKCFSRSYILNKFSIHCRADHFEGAIMGTNSILKEVRTTEGSYQTLDKVAFAAFGREGGKLGQTQPL